MSTMEKGDPVVTIAEEMVETVCIGQIAALAALRAEMAALSTMMSGLPRHKAESAAAGQLGARAIDPDPEDNYFDNMPV